MQTLPRVNVYGAYHPYPVSNTPSYNLLNIYKRLVLGFVQQIKITVNNLCIYFCSSDFKYPLLIWGVTAELTAEKNDIVDLILSFFCKICFMSVLSFGPAPLNSETV